MTNIAFHHDSTQNEYEAFVISYENFYKYTIAKAAVSADYLKSIRAFKPAAGVLKVQRTKCFDIFNTEARMEFLRCVIACARYFADRPEARILTNPRFWY
ncbi:hypothetical protein BJX64DRAFT_250272 [Aspergillus heterothallicus]